MPRQWTAEQKRAQAERIKRWQPWTRSTGPRTAAGKARTRLNARKSGRYSCESRAIAHDLRAMGRYLRQIRLWIRWQGMIQYRHPRAGGDPARNGMRAPGWFAGSPPAWG